MPGFLDYFLSINFALGACITLSLTVLSMAVGIADGLMLALVKTSGIRFLQAPADFYIWLFRGTPVLLQLIFIFNALPQMGLRFSAFTSAVIALALNESAYMAEDHPGRHPIGRSGAEERSACWASLRGRSCATSCCHKPCA